MHVCFWLTCDHLLLCCLKSADRHHADVPQSQPVSSLDFSLYFDIPSLGFSTSEMDNEYTQVSLVMKSKQNSVYEFLKHC